MRRTIIKSGAVAALALSLLTACGEDGSGADGSVSIGQQVPSMVLPLVIAEKEGLLEDHGIKELDLVSMPDPAAMFQAVQKGQLDGGVGVPAGLSGFNSQSGGDLVFVHAGLWLINSFFASDESGIPVATADTWMDTVKAWKGKVIGVPALGGAIDKIVRALAAEAGLSEKDIDVLAVGGGAPSVAAFEQGNVDVVLADPIAIKELESKKVGKIVLELGTENSPPQYREVLASGVYVSGKNVDEDVSSDIAAAWQAGVDFMVDPANKADVIEDIAEFLQVDEDLAESFYSYRSQYDTVLDDATWQHTIDEYVAAGVMPAPKDAGSLIHPLP